MLLSEMVHLHRNDPATAQYARAFMALEYGKDSVDAYSDPAIVDEFTDWLEEAEAFQKRLECY